MTTLGQLDRVAREQGFEARHDWQGFYVCTIEEGEYEDQGHASVGFDGRPHYATARDALEAILEAAALLT